MDKQFPDNRVLSNKEADTKNDIIADFLVGNSAENDENFNYQYYNQYGKSYRTGLQLAAEMEQLVAVRDELWGQLSKL